MDIDDILCQLLSVFFSKLKINCEKNDGKFGGNELIIVLGTIHIHTIRKFFKVSGKNFSSIYKFKSIETLRGT